MVEGGDTSEFVTDLKKYAELKARFPTNEAEVVLETSDLAGDNKADDILECLICFNIVWDPK